MFRVLRYPDDIALLRRRSVDVPDSAFGTSRLRGFGDALGETLIAQTLGAGLAATQVDVDPVLRVMAVNRGGDAYSVLYNPRVVSHAGEVEGPEGCLSFPGVNEQLTAPVELVVQYRDAEGAAKERRCVVHMARCVWRTVQYLDGKTVLDRMGAMKRRSFIKNLERWRREEDEES